VSRWGKRDEGHADIGAAFRAIGWPILDTSRHAGLGCDFITRHKDGFPIFLEVKRPGPPHCRKLTDSEKRLQAMNISFYRIAQSVEEAFEAVGLPPSPF
jgi:hypothetical protein